MKHLLLAFLPFCLLLPAFAQVPAQPSAPLLPPPAAPAGPDARPEPPLGPFKDQKERRSYGLGSFLGDREKKNATSNPDQTTVNAGDLLSGLTDGLSGARSIDYAGGLAMAAQIKRSGIEIDADVLADAVRTAVENKMAKVPPADVQAIMQEIQADIQQRQQAKAKAEAEKNLAASAAWLEENAKKEGVKATPSGLQYLMETNGAGRTPGPRDVVTVNLIGTAAADSTEFDRTADGTPARRAMQALPKGLQEGMQLMKAGGKARFWLPPVLGFGETPRGPGLKTNAVLAYTVELVASEEPPASQPGAPIGADGQPVPQVKREPITAVTPPVSVEIPPGGGPPKIKIEGQPNTPQVPPPAPAPENK